MKMVRTIIILALVAGVSFFIAKYFWIRTPTDTTNCEELICPVPEGYKDK